MAQALGEVKAEPVQIPSNLIEAEFMVFSSRGQFPKTEATKSVLLFFFNIMFECSAKRGNGWQARIGFNTYGL